MSLGLIILILEKDGIAAAYLSMHIVPDRDPSDDRMRSLKASSRDNLQSIVSCQTAACKLMSDMRFLLTRLYTRVTTSFWTEMPRVKSRHLVYRQYAAEV